jgi:hypothetical protein
MKYNINKELLLEEAVVTQNKNNSNAISTGNLGTVGVGVGAAGLAAKKLGAAGLAKGLGAKGLMTLASKGSGLYTDPTETNVGKSMLYSGLGSAAITGGANLIGAAAGSGVPLGAIGIGAAGAGIKGAAVGGLGAKLFKGRNSFVGSVLLPTGVVAASAPLSNAAFDAAGYSNIEIDVPMSTAITAGIGGLGYMLRGKKTFL